MKWKPYPKYKDSGVEWLGEVPEGWEIKSGKYLGVLRGSVAPREEELTHGTEGTMFAKVDDLNQLSAALVLSNTSARVESAVKARRLVLFPKRGAAIFTNKVAVVEGPILFDSNIMGWEIFACHDTSFVAYSLLARRLDDLADVSTVPQINNKHLDPALFTVPSRSEQQLITDFLRRETAKIDTLIGKQERLIELLQEKRQALISYAVTKGLNPNATMKPSGVEWLGEVPAHWTAKRIKWVARMESGHTPDKKIESYWENCDIPWVSLNDTALLRVNDYVDDTAFKVNALGIANSSARLLPQGTVVFSRDATVGLCAITNRVMAVSQHFIAWVCGPEILSEFLLFALRSMDQELERRTMGATVKTIGMPDVRTLVVPVPPVDEQQRIVSHIFNQRERLDTTIRKTQLSIDLIREHRTALISAAVTGKIDVRDAA